MDGEHLKYQIGSNIAQVRKKCGMTQAELGEKIGFSDKAVSKWERAESVPDVLTLVELSRVFGVTVDALVADKAPEPAGIQKQTPPKLKTGVLVLSSLLVWFVALLTNVVLSGVGVPKSWVAFVYALPVNAIVLLCLRCAFGRKNWNYALVSLIVWGCLVSLYVSLAVFAGVYVWKLFLMGLLGQAAITLWFWMLRPQQEARNG